MRWRRFESDSSLSPTSDADQRIWVRSGMTSASFPSIRAAMLVATRSAADLTGVVSEVSVARRGLDLGVA